MKKLNRIILSVICCLNCFFTYSQTVRWQEAPKWDTVEMFGDQLLRVELSGKWGVVGLDGTQIVPCVNAIITDICDGRFLALNDKGKIISLWSEEGNPFPIATDWFVDLNYPYYSNNRLAVHDSQGRWGFLNNAGKIVIEPSNEFIFTFPFFHDLAAVQYNDKEKSWGYIYADGSPLKYESSKISNGYKDITFASSYTKIGDSPNALIRLKERLYMIDQYGNITNQIIPKKGLPINVLKLTPGVPVSSDNISFIFNEFGEITSLKKSNHEYVVLSNRKTKESIYPTVDNITIDSVERIIIDELIISPQFQEIIPLSENQILVKKEEHWGILFVDRKQDVIKIKQEIINYNRSRKKTRNIDLLIINGNDKTKVYRINSNGEKEYLEISEDRVTIPISLIAKDTALLVGLETDGVVLDPITIPTNQLSFATTSPASTKNSKEGINVILTERTKYIDDNNKAVFLLDIKRNDYNKLIMEISVNGNVRRSKVTNNKQICASNDIKFNGKKEVKVNVKVKDGEGQIVCNKDFKVFHKN